MDEWVLIWSCLILWLQPDEYWWRKRERERTHLPTLFIMFHFTNFWLLLSTSAIWQHEGFVFLFGKFFCLHVLFLFFTLDTLFSIWWTFFMTEQTCREHHLCRQTLTFSEWTSELKQGQKEQGALTRVGSCLTCILWQNLTWEGVLSLWYLCSHPSPCSFSSKKKKIKERKKWGKERGPCFRIPFLIKYEVCCMMWRWLINAELSQT